MQTSEAPAYPLDLDNRLRHEVTGALENFAEFMQAALYGQQGYYKQAVQRVGRRADYVTSVELGDVFATCLAQRIGLKSSVSPSLGFRSAPRVVDYGGGAGALSRSWGKQAFNVEAAVVDISPFALDTCWAEGVLAAERLSGLPWQPDVIVAHELFDNFPARLVSSASTELVVRTDEDGRREFVEINVGLDLKELAARWYPDGCQGVLPVPISFPEWLSSVQDHSARPTRLIIVDFGASSRELASRPDLPVRSFRGHTRVNPLEHPVGSADLVCDVPSDILMNWLGEAGWVCHLYSQAEWLANNGIDEVMSSFRMAARSAALEQDVMTQLQAHSRLVEARTLIDAKGLGSFFVIEATLE